MRKRFYFTTIGALACAALGSQGAEVLVWQESFETDGEGSRYTVIGGGDDGGTDFFARRELGSNGTIAKNGTLDGTWMWGARNMDNAPGEPPPESGLANTEGKLVFHSIDISGVGNLRLEVAAALGVGEQEADNDAAIRVRFDGGEWIELGGFKSASSNNPPRHYVGDEQTLTTAESPRIYTFFTDWGWEVVGNGSTMEIDLRVNSNAAAEDYYFDNFRIYGDDSAKTFTAVPAQGGGDNVMTEPTSGTLANTLTLTFAEAVPAEGIDLAISGSRETMNTVDFGAESIHVNGGTTTVDVPFQVVQDGSYTGQEIVDLFLSAPGYNTARVRMRMDNTTPAPDIVIMELGNAVPGLTATDLHGDWNNNGIRGTADDGFIEIVNFGTVPVDISGWTTGDLISPRHVFPEGSIILPNKALVVFGRMARGTYGNALIQESSSGGNGLGYNGITAGADDAWLRAPFGAELERYTMKGGPAVKEETAAGIPEGTPGHDDGSSEQRLELSRDAPFFVHSLIEGADYATASPGTWPDGTPYFETENVITLALSADTIAEDAGENAMTGTITLETPAPTGGFEVTLKSEDGIVLTDDEGGFAPDEITLDSITVVVPEGATTATFRIGAYNDQVLDGDRLVTLNAVGGDYVFGGSADFTVTDVAVDDLNVVINEVMPDSIGGGFDLNMDGIPEDDSGDQFIEVVNNSGREVNLSGWYIEWVPFGAFGTILRSHTFPEGTWVSDQGSVVVMGKISDEKAQDAFFNGAIVQQALDGEGNPTINGVGLVEGSSVSMKLYNEYGYAVDTFEYDAASGEQDQSVIRSPEVTGETLGLHLDQSGLAFLAYSPGTLADGTPFAGNGEILLPTIFTRTAVSSGSGWYWDPTFGWLFTGAPVWDIPWVYSANLGTYWYVLEPSEFGGMWAYDYSLSSWVYTTYEVYPWTWVDTAAAWQQRSGA